LQHESASHAAAADLVGTGAAAGGSDRLLPGQATLVASAAASSKPPTAYEVSVTAEAAALTGHPELQLREQQAAVPAAEASPDRPGKRQKVHVVTPAGREVISNGT
jgi:hypothetical protein